MSPVFVLATHIITPAGNGIGPLWDRIVRKDSSIQAYEADALSRKPYQASRFSEEQWEAILDAYKDDLTAFEKLALYSAQAAISTVKTDPSKTLFILSATKGNIAELGQLPDERIHLHDSSRRIAGALGISKFNVLSQACISGLSAIIYGSRLIQQGQYEQVVVTGADLVSRFVLSGFQSFHAISSQPCRPFDKARNGINLGEAAATIILSNKTENPLAIMAGGAMSNDANHISGPSRTGEELASAIKGALKEAGIGAASIGAISAHGTATAYNDEMESRAFAHSGLLQAPLHSVKGVTGHTLGAAGVVESALAIACLQRQMTLPSVGFEEAGVPEPVTVSKDAVAMDLEYMLKTASGFGGSNAAIVWKRSGRQ